MDDVNEQQTGSTVRLRRPPPKVYTDELGHTVWMSGLLPYRLELDAGAPRSTDPYNSSAAGAA